MFAMKLSDLAATLKEYFIPCGKGNEKALLLSFDVGMGGSTAPHQRSFLHFVLYSPHGGPVHTFFAEQDFGDKRSIEDLEWENASNHDSEWRSDGIESPVDRVYFRMAREVNDFRKELGVEEVAPKDMPQNCWFNMFRPHGISLIDVVVERDYDSDRYKFILKFE